jgi:hypothetical protein
MTIEKAAKPLFRAGCGLPQRTRCARTFAGREVFFPTYTPPEKMNFTLFRRLAAKLCEAF